jgi:hypothetical protein
MAGRRKAGKDFLRTFPQSGRDNGGFIPAFERREPHLHFLAKPAGFSKRRETASQVRAEIEGQAGFPELGKLFPFRFSPLLFFD